MNYRRPSLSLIHVINDGGLIAVMMTMMIGSILILMIVVITTEYRSASLWRKSFNVHQSYSLTEF